MPIANVFPLFLIVRLKQFVLIDFRFDDIDDNNIIGNAFVSEDNSRKITISR